MHEELLGTMMRPNDNIIAKSLPPVQIHILKLQPLCPHSLAQWTIHWPYSHSGKEADL